MSLKAFKAASVQMTYYYVVKDSEFCGCFGGTYCL